MSKIIAYIRVSTQDQDTNNQKVEILEYSQKNDLKISKWISLISSSQRTRKQRRIEELMADLSNGDTLIVSELSRLGRSVSEVIDIVDHLGKNNIRLVCLKERIDVSESNLNSTVMLTLFSLLSEVEHKLISMRTKEALAAKKAQGQKLGKPLGTIQKSKFDKDIDRIKELLSYGLSVRKMANVLGYSDYQSLNYYIKRRNLKQKSEI